MHTSTTFSMLLLCFHLFSVNYLSAQHNISTTSSSKSLSVAMVPCLIVDLGRSFEDKIAVSEDRLATNLSRELQAEIFSHLIDKLERQPISNLDVQHFSDTNNMLSAWGVSIQQSWGMSVAELARRLNVDAIIRISVRQTSSHARRIVTTADMPGTPNDDNGISQTRGKTWIAIEFLDGSSGMPIGGSDVSRWKGYNRKKNSRLGRRVANALWSALEKEAVQASRPVSG